MMQLPFRLIVIAPTSSGKSTMIHHILSKSQFGYKKVFKNNVFLFSPSNNFDEVLYSLQSKMKIKKILWMRNLLKISWKNKTN
jgi:hypothetical protein